MNRNEPGVMTDAKRMTGVVTSRRDITDELWVVRVRPEQAIAFRPGQYVTVGLPSEARLIERPYSVASAPRETELEFFLELIRKGRLSPHLYDVPEGGRVYLRRESKGRLLFDAESGHVNHFMVATVTGVAPFLSMIRDFAAQTASRTSFTRVQARLRAAATSLPVPDPITRTLFGFARSRKGRL